LCVELDTGSIFSDYIEYISNINNSSLNSETSLINVLYGSSGYNTKRGVENFYNKGDEFLALRNDMVKNFPLPQPNNFGFCDNYKSPSFLTPIKDE